MVDDVRFLKQNPVQFAIRSEAPVRNLQRRIGLDRRTDSLPAAAFAIDLPFEERHLDRQRRTAVHIQQRRKLAHHLVGTQPGTGKILDQFRFSSIPLRLHRQHKLGNQPGQFARIIEVIGPVQPFCKFQFDFGNMPDQRGPDIIAAAGISGPAPFPYFPIGLMQAVAAVKQVFEILVHHKSSFCCCRVLPAFLKRTFVNFSARRPCRLRGSFRRINRRLCSTDGIPPRNQVLLPLFPAPSMLSR